MLTSNWVQCILLDSYHARVPIFPRQFTNSLLCLFIHSIECPKMYGGEDEYNLHRVIISTGYYGSCRKCDNNFVKYNPSINKQQNPSPLNEKTPLLPVYVPTQTWRFINIRIISLGILFIGGVTIGSYLLYEQGTIRTSNFIIIHDWFTWFRFL